MALTVSPFFSASIYDFTRFFTRDSGCFGSSRSVAGVASRAATASRSRLNVFIADIVADDFTTTTVISATARSRRLGGIAVTTSIEIANKRSALPWLYRQQIGRRDMGRTHQEVC